jgi:hypothetical protein
MESAGQQGKTYSARVMYIALSAWSFIHGMTSLQISQRYAAMLGGSAGEFIRLEVERYIETIGLKSS